RDLLGSLLGATPRLVVIDLRPEVVEGRRVRRQTVRRREHPVGALTEQLSGGRGRARDSVPVQHGDRGGAGGGSPVLDLLTERDGGRLLRRTDVPVSARRH